jgi:hypothetical protein
MTPGSHHHRRIDMQTSLLTHPVRRAAISVALLIAVVALLIAVVVLFRLGPAPAPVAPVLGADAIPAVHQTAPESADWEPGAVVSITGDSVATQSPADAPIGMVEPDRATVNAGGAMGGVDMRHRAGGAAGGIVGS